MTSQQSTRSLFPPHENRHPSFVEIRLIPAKRDIAFVEYADEGSAGIAKDALHNFKIDGETKMKVSATSNIAYRQKGIGKARGCARQK